MDPNLAQPVPASPPVPIPTPPPIPTRFPQKNILLIVVLILILLALFFLGLNYSKRFKTPPKPIIKTQAKPQIVPHQDPRLSTIKSIDGKITAIAKDSISLNTNSGVQTFKLDKILNIGKLSATQSGQTTTGSIIDLKIGQEVSTIILKDSNSVRFIYIKP